MDNGNSIASKTMESMEIASGGVGLGTPTHCNPTQIWNKQDTIPEDPLLAETHYTEVIFTNYVYLHHMISHDVQYDDFEDDDECSDLEDSQV